jgi:hypothetical protein
MQTAQITLREKARVVLAFAKHDLNRKIVEPFELWLIHRMPRSFVMWAMVRAGIECAGNRNHSGEVVTDVPFVTVLERWGNGTDRRRR